MRCSPHGRLGCLGSDADHSAPPHLVEAFEVSIPLRSGGSPRGSIHLPQADFDDAATPVRLELPGKLATQDERVSVSFAPETEPQCAGAVSTGTDL
jgi:hypothetical protein